MGKKGKKNDFKFLSFAERISKVSVDILHRFKRLDAIPEDAACFFREAVDKWTDLDCSDNFRDFKQDLPLRELHTLAQLLYYQDAVAQTLQNHLLVSSSTCLPALLDLLVSFARDLQSDFYPHFWRFFDVVFSQLLPELSQHAEIIDSCFTSLSYLFKFSWKSLIVDINEACLKFLPLFAHRKDYIRRFASESFSFLVRKLKDATSFAQFCLGCVERDLCLVDGVAKLFCQAMKGVRCQYHSNATNLYLQLLKLLQCDKWEHRRSFKRVELMQQVMLEITMQMVKSTDKDNAKPMLNVILVCIDDAGPSKDTNYIGRLVEVLLVWIEFKNALLVEEPSKIVLMLEQHLVKSQAIADGYVTDVLLKCLACLIRFCSLPTNKLDLIQEHVFKPARFSQLALLKFADALFDVPAFDSLVLPFYANFAFDQLRSCDASDSNALVKVLASVARLITLKRPIWTSVDELASTERSYRFTSYPLFGHAGSKTDSMYDEIFGILKRTILAVIRKERDVRTCAADGLALLHYAFIILPHVSASVLDVGIADAVSGFFADFFDISVASTVFNLSDANSILAVFYGYVMVLLSARSKDVAALPLITPPRLIIDILRRFPENVIALRLGDSYFGGFDKPSKDVLSELMDILQHSIASPLHEVRLLSLRILTHFPLDLPKAGDANYGFSLFELCLATECVPLSMSEYRERLRLLRKLSIEELHLILPTPVDAFKPMVLRFLIGQLYCNFSLIWQPVVDIISALVVHTSNTSIMWPIVASYLNSAATNAYDQIFGKLATNKTAYLDTMSSNPDDASLLWHSHLGELTAIQDHRVDHVHFRVQMWKLLGQCVSVAENKSRLFTPLFVTFIEAEFYSSDMMAAPFEDLSVDSTDGQEDLSSLAVPEEPQNMDEPCNEVSAPDSHDLANDEAYGSATPTPHIARDKQSSDRRHDIRSAVMRTLIAKLTCLSHFHSPRSLFLEPKLWQIYMKLLLNSNKQVQKAVMDCVFTYKLKYLTPYRENIEHILDEKTLKDELVLFGMSEDVTVVATAHRADVLQILLRLLYGKLYGKATGPGSHLASVRRNIILRFVAGCSSSELTIFIDLFLEPLKAYIEEGISALDVIRRVDTQFSLKQSVPLSRLRGLVSMLSLILKRLGHVLTNRLHYLLNACIAVAAILCRIEESKSSVKAYLSNALKSLKVLSLQLFIDFFNSFDSLDFTTDELSAILRTVVNSQITVYPSHGCYSPSGLTALFLAWSQNPRYFCLLNAELHSGGSESSAVAQTPLAAVFKLLSNSNCQAKVQSALMEIVASLLTTADFVPSPENGDALKISQSTCFMQKFGLMASLVQNNEELNFGTKILLPFIEDLLRSIESRFCANTNRQPDSKDLDVLSRICPFVADAEQSQKMIELLLPYLEKNVVKGEDAQISLLKSTLHLTARASDPAAFINSFGNLFELISLRTPRQILCDILKAVGERQGAFAEIALIIAQLNSWDARRLEEPDYSLRLAVHSKLNEEILSISECSDKRIDPSVALLLLHNFSYAIQRFDDMSLRDNASLSLRHLIEKVNHDYHADTASWRLKFGSHLVAVLKRGVKHTSEIVRNEFVAVLSLAVRLFGDLKLLSSLSQLCAEESEQDFFENIRHIQLHRRCRAIRRLAEKLESSARQKSLPSRDVLRWEPLMSLIVPLVRPFLFDAAYAKNVALSDEATRLIGAICLLLPWPRYKLMLQYYLTRLQKDVEHQKTVVKLLVAVLDSFHFNLNLAGCAVAEEQQEKENVAKPMEAAAAEDDDVVILDEGDDEMTAPVACDVRKSSGEDLESKILETEKAAANAEKIHNAVAKDILPKLNTVLSKRSALEMAHKATQTSVANTTYDEDQEILRIPVALAMVKLLQRLSSETLHSYLPGIFFKICVFLRSRSQDIRDASRKTLFAVLKSLGPGYLSFFVREIKGIMTKGYQVHVMAYTVNAVLLQLVDQLKPGDLEPCMSDVIAILNNELFGNISDEKDVVEITRNLMEARGNKSYETYQLVGRFCTKDHLKLILDPLKEVLGSQQKHKVVQKVAEVCRRIAQGLAQNEALPVEVCLVFVHSLLSDNLESLFVGSKSKSQLDDDDFGDEETLSGGRANSSSIYLIPKEPGRSGAAPLTSRKSTLYVLVELALQEFLSLMNQSRIDPSSKQHLHMLEPYVELFLKCLQSMYSKVVALGLQCLTSLVKFPLASLRREFKSFVERLFLLLRQYAGLGTAARGDSMELIQRLFKAVTCVVRDASFYVVTKTQLEVLLQYAEQDIYDLNRQTTAFSLIKALLSRKLICPEIHDLLTKIRELVVTSGAEHTRQQCRQLFLQYCLDYPLGKKIRRHTDFFLTQLAYELEDGRLSVMEMLNSFIEAFPQKLIDNVGGQMFVNLAAQLINDESEKCRGRILSCLKLLLAKVSPEKRNSYYEMALAWFSDEDLTQNRLGAKLIATFAEFEGVQFERRISSVLSAIRKALDPTLYTAFERLDSDIVIERSLLLAQLLATLTCIGRNCPGFLRAPQYAKELNQIWRFICSHGQSASHAVQLSALQAFAQLFAVYDPAELAPSHGAVRSKEFLLKDRAEKCRELAELHVAVLRQFPLLEDVGEEAVRNLAFLTKVVRFYSASFESADNGHANGFGDTSSDTTTASDVSSLSPFNGSSREAARTDFGRTSLVPVETKSPRELSLAALSKDLSRICKIETVKNPKITTKRKCVFQWIASVCPDLPNEQLIEYVLPAVLSNLHREIALIDTDESLKNLANEVCDLLKTKIGLEKFSEMFAEVQKFALRKREERKRSRALEAVSEPQAASAKKLLRTKAREAAKKRKLVELKPYKAKRHKNESAANYQLNNAEF